jgi:methyl-accepting chemotaxis protein
MAADAAQQRQVIDQVRATGDRVHQTTQQQGLLANAAAAAEAMRQQMHELIAAVSVFRLRDGALPAARGSDGETMRLVTRRR